MTKAARSVFIFGIYLVFLGGALVVIPNVLLNVFGVPTTDEVWIRVAGVLALLVGYFYIQSAKNNIKEIFPLTVHARCAVMFFFAAFVMLKLVSPVLILFGAVDMCGAMWTLKEMQNTRLRAT